MEYSPVFFQKIFPEIFLDNFQKKNFYRIFPGFFLSRAG